MKKTLFLSLLAAVLFGVSSYAETQQTILLLHEGTGRNFAPNQMQEAVNAAVADDTLYLNEGVYPLAGDTLTIDKEVNIIGAGINTRLLGTIDVSIPDSVTLSGRLLDALCLTKDLVVSRPVNRLKFRKVQFEGSMIWNATTRDVELDRCYINNFESSIKLKSSNAVNCKIACESIVSDNYGNLVSFMNCAIKEIVIYVGNSSLGHRIGFSYSTYLNCIIYNLKGSSSGVYNLGTNETKNATYQYSTLNINTKYRGIVEHCYNADSGILDWSQNSGCSLSQEEMIEKGWLGNDGSVVGLEGGSAPYTLIPNGIRVRQSKLSIDGEQKTLNVNLKLQAK